jgi:hypothetical protein
MTWNKRKRHLAALEDKIERAERAGRRLPTGDVPPRFRGSVLDALDAAGMTGATWAAWRTVAKAIYGLRMSGPELELFKKQTGREAPPAEAVTEAWLIVGRRGGKSRFDALTAMFAGGRRDYKKLLAPGERATVPVIAADRKQARTVMRYLRGLCALPEFKPFVSRVLKESVDLRTGAVIEVHTASFRSTRGYTLAGAVCDELAFWHADDADEPDAEILAALRPGMATIPDALLLGSSTPYARRGALWDAFSRHYGKDDAPGVLVWVADSRTMNPSLSESVVAKAFEADAVAAASEYGTDGTVRFRSDVEAFLAREAVEAVTPKGRREIARAAGVSYVAFADPSGGSQDAFTLAIAHREGERGVLDLVRERHPPFSPDAVVTEFAAVLRSYGCSKVTGDRYGGEWPRERFRVHGISYEPSERTKSDVYGALLPMVNAARVELLDLPVLRAQLLGLERRTSRIGKDSVDHAPGGHDDSANAAAGALVLAAGTATREWAVHKVTLGQSGRIIVSPMLPAIARAFDLEPCGDPVSGEGRGPDALERAQAAQYDADEARRLTEGRARSDSDHAGPVRLVRA